MSTRRELVVSFQTNQLLKIAIYIIFESNFVLVSTKQQNVCHHIITCCSHLFSESKIQVKTARKQQWYLTANRSEKNKFNRQFIPFDISYDFRVFSEYIFGPRTIDFCKTKSFQINLSKLFRIFSSSSTITTTLNCLRKKTIEKWKTSMDSIIFRVRTPKKTEQIYTFYAIFRNTKAILNKKNWL